MEEKIMRNATRVYVTVLAAMLVSATATAAQEAPRAAAARPCGEQPARGDLGYGALSCSNCTHYVDREDPTHDRWEFRSEPVVERVRPGGAADGKLRSGDTIIAIDGHLITTREGGRRFTQVTPGQPVMVTVRRADRELVVTILPETECRAPAPPAVGVPPTRLPTVPAPPDIPVDVAPRVPVPTPPVGPTIADAMPTGWMGLSISCSNCGIHVSEDSAPVWQFAEPPIVESVERGSPAHAAGIRGGDRLTHIDGLAMTSEAGGRRFGALRPGQHVQLRVERDGRARETEFVTGERSANAPAADQVSPPGAPSSPLPAPIPAPAQGRPPQPRAAPAPRTDVVRFTGFVGTALIEVMGGPITVTETEDEVVIQSSDITVRIRKAQNPESGRR
jgi:membrane-associated protease RseP (regulator of RpoE activity)